MGGQALICGCCRRERLSCDLDRVGEPFICAQCHADAIEFIRIQDTIWAGEDAVAGDDVHDERKSRD